MHFLPHSVPPAFRLDDRLVEKIREIIGVSIGAKNDVATAAAIAAVRSAFWDKFFAPKTDRSAAAAASLRKNFDSIDKHLLFFPSTIRPLKESNSLCGFQS